MDIMAIGDMGPWVAPF